MKLTTKNITCYAISSGIILCLLGAIWSPEECVKWLLSGIYLAVVGKFFGLNFRNERITGEILHRKHETLNDFIRMKK